MNKNQTSTVRFAVIGCGGMAQSHMNYFAEIDGLEFVAVSDVQQDTLDKVTAKYDVKGYSDAEALMASGEVDAVLIATPHYFHPDLAIRAFELGLHVLVEKPVAVTAKRAQEINDAHAQHPDLIYACMFNQRTDVRWKMIKHLIESGQVGELKRVNWTITNWYRTQTYYNSGGWRATWKGEGGGVLINQCPHNLDLFQWWVGMPKQVTAHVGLGKYHDIEVEDEVVATMQFENGAIGTFITSTGEAPGINRIEIIGDHGTIIGEDGKDLVFNETTIPVSEYTKTSSEIFKGPDVNVHTIKPGGDTPQHKGITRNFINAILHGEPLIAPGEDGIHGLELGNAMLMAGLTRQPVDLPMDRAAYAKLIDDLIAKSGK